MVMQHKTLADGRWGKFTLFEQLGNVGSEISRALIWKDKDGTAYHNSIERALELMDLTVADPRWQGRLKEIMRARELIADAIYGGKEYGSTMEDLDRYFFYFALAARMKK